MNALLGPVVILLLVTASAAGCVATGPSNPGAAAARAGCLSDPGAGAPGSATDPPLFFLFCTQSP